MSTFKWEVLYILAKIPGLAGQTQSYVHQNLETNANYYYTIYAYDNAGNYSICKYSGITPNDTTPPSEVINATAEMDNTIVDNKVIFDLMVLVVFYSPARTEPKYNTI